MSSIKQFFDKFKKKTIVEDRQVTRDIAYLTNCVKQFEEQLGADEECKQFLEYLSTLPSNRQINDELINHFKFIMKEFITRELNMDDFCLETTPFQQEACLYSNYATAKKEQDGSYSICPVITHDKLISFTQDFFLTTPNESIVETLKKCNTQSHEDLLHSKINTYYGKLGFIKTRTKAIMDAIEMIRTNYQLLPDEYQFIEMKVVETLEVQSKINSIGTTVVKESRFRDPVTDMTRDEYFDVVVPAFRELLQIEEELSFISQRIWENYFNTRGARFVHALSSGIVESDKMPKICTSLYLDDLATIPYGHTGYEYGVSMENIDCISECDIGSWHIKKTDFLRSGIVHGWQWNEETCMFYEDGYYSKLLPPDYIEMKARQKNKGSDHMSYTEILLINTTKKIQPVKAFYTDLATKEEIEQITAMAHKQGIEVEYIDTKTIKQKMDNKALS